MSVTLSLAEILSLPRLVSLLTGLMPYNNGIVGREHLYLFNYAIDRSPGGNPETGYLECDGSPAKAEVLEHFRSGDNDYYWLKSFGKRDTTEELYQIASDPECLKNLAYDPQFRELKQKMRSRLESALTQQRDPRVLGQGDVFDRYPSCHAWPFMPNFHERFMAGAFKTDFIRWVNPSDFEPEPLD